MDHAQVSETDIVRARRDPRFRQILLARSLEQLLGSLHRMQRGPLGSDSVRDLRQGALMAVELTDRLRVIDDNLRRTPLR